MTLEELASGGVTLLSHAPWGLTDKSPKQAKVFLEEAHRLGIKVIPYVSLYKVIDSRQMVYTPREGYVHDMYIRQDHPFFKEVDLAHHPEWALIDDKGTIRRPFDMKDYPAGIHQSCTNVAGIADAYVQGIKNLMDMGFDGVFVDNVHPTPICYGPKFGKHEHLYPDKDNLYTYPIVLKRVYDLVKHYGEDKVVILNPTGNPDWLDERGDGKMLESYICTFVEKNRQNRRTSFETAMRWARSYADYLNSGKAPVALSYIGWSNYPLKDDAFYCYACAQLSGFLWTSNVWRSSWTPDVEDREGNDLLRLLYRADLKNPLADMAEKDGITYRLFANGLVAVNPGDSQLRVQLPLTKALGEACDLYSGQVHPVSSGYITVHIPPESGRVYLSSDAVFSSYLRECVLAAKGVQQRLNRLSDQSAEAKLRQWLQKHSAAIEDLAKIYEKVPDADDRGRFLTELAIQQNKLNGVMNSHEDEIVNRRLKNLREYAGRLASLVTGVTLLIEAPPKAQPGSKVTICICLNTPEKAKDPKFALETADGWKVRLVSAAQKKDRMEFEISVPDEAPIHVPETLTAMVSFQTADVQEEKPRLTVVQTCGLQITQQRNKTIASDE